MEQITLVVTVSLSTILIGLGVYRAYVLAKKDEPKALSAVVLAAFHAAEREVIDRQAAARTAQAEAEAAAAQLAQLRAQVSGVSSTPSA